MRSWPRRRDSSVMKRVNAFSRETAYRPAFKPHLRTETTRTIPEPIFIAALVGTGLRLVSVPDEIWSACEEPSGRRKEDERLAGSARSALKANRQGLEHG